MSTEIFSVAGVKILEVDTDFSAEKIENELMKVTGVDGRHFNLIKLDSDKFLFVLVDEISRNPFVSFSWDFKDNPLHGDWMDETLSSLLSVYHDRFTARISVRIQRPYESLHGWLNPLGLRDRFFLWESDLRMLPPCEDPDYHTESQRGRYITLFWCFDENAIVCTEGSEMFKENIDFYDLVNTPSRIGF